MMMTNELCDQLKQLNKSVQFGGAYHKAFSLWGNPIGRGSSRDVFAVSDTLVIKVDENGYQNYNEANPMTQERGRGAITRTLLVGPWYRWLLVERCNNAAAKTEWKSIRCIIKDTLRGGMSYYGTQWDSAVRFLFGPLGVAYTEALYETQWGMKGDIPVLCDLGVLVTERFSYGKGYIHV